MKRSSMPKRLTDTAQWRDPWFRKLTPGYKALWLYICAECDLAGVWKADFEMASFIISEPLNENEALECINFEKERILQLKQGYWLIKDFVSFQYGVLGDRSPIHIKVLSLIESHRDTIGYPVEYSIPCKEKKKEKENTIRKEVLGENDGSFIESLRSNPAYFHIDIVNELHKMDAWLSTRPGRKKTKRFVVNWLNRIEKPMGPANGIPARQYTPQQIRAALSFKRLEEKLRASGNLSKGS